MKLKLHPETKHGAGTGSRAKRTKNEVANLATSSNNIVPRYTESAAAATGESERNLSLLNLSNLNPRRSVPGGQIGHEIAPRYDEAAAVGTATQIEVADWLGQIGQASRKRTGLANLAKPVEADNSAPRYDEAAADAKARCGRQVGAHEKSATASFAVEVDFLSAITGQSDGEDHKI